MTGDHEQAERLDWLPGHLRKLEVPVGWWDFIASQQRRVEDLAAQLAEAQKDAESLDRLLESLRLEWETEREELRAQLADERDRNKARIKREQNLKAQLAEREREDELVEAAIALADYWPSKNVEKHYSARMQRFLRAVRAVAATHSDSEDTHA